MLHKVLWRRSQAQSRATASKFTREVNSNMMKQFLQEEEGQTLVEYGLLISLIALVVIAVLTLLGGKINGVFTTANNSIKTTT